MVIVVVSHIQRSVLVVCLKKNQNAPRPSDCCLSHSAFSIGCCLKKLLLFLTFSVQCSRPSEHPPVMGEKCQNV